MTPVNTAATNMRSFRPGFSSLAAWICFAVLLALLLETEAQSTTAGHGPIHLQARLVWGTNSEKPPKPEVTDLDGKLKAKLRGVFKWKNYFQCHAEKFAVPSSATKRVKLSDQCEIEVENQGASWLEVKLYGEGKLLVKKRQMITPGELLILAGDGKDDTAWFVVLSLDTPPQKP